MLNTAALNLVIPAEGIPDLKFLYRLMKVYTLNGQIHKVVDGEYLPGIGLTGRYLFLQLLS